MSDYSQFSGLDKRSFGRMRQKSHNERWVFWHMLNLLIRAIIKYKEKQKELANMLQIGDRVKMVDNGYFPYTKKMAVITKVLAWFNGECLYEVNNQEGVFYADRDSKSDYPQIRFVMDKHLQSVRQPWMKKYYK